MRSTIVAILLTACGDTTNRPPPPGAPPDMACLSIGVCEIKCWEAFCQTKNGLIADCVPGCAEHCKRQWKLCHPNGACNPGEVL